MSTYHSVLIHRNTIIIFFGCLYSCSLHWTSSVRDTATTTRSDCWGLLCCFTLYSEYRTGRMFGQTLPHRCLFGNCKNINIRRMSEKSITFRMWSLCCTLLYWSIGIYVTTFGAWNNCFVCQNQQRSSVSPEGGWSSQAQVMAWSACSLAVGTVSTFLDCFPVGL